MIRSSRFWKEIVLLASLMLFCVYSVHSYNIDSYDADTKGDPIQPDTALSPQNFYMLLPLVELPMVALVGSMFVALSMAAVHAPDLPGDEQPTEFRNAMLYAFGAAAVWHLFCIFWWLLRIGSDSFNRSSIWFHGFVMAAHSACAVAFYAMTSRVDRRRPMTIEWIAVIVFFLIILGVYVYRIRWYLDPVRCEFPRVK